MNEHREALFDVGERRDASPSSHGEDSFAFMNRACGPMWQRIRDELDRWFTDYPGDHAGDLRARFRSKEPEQHYAAWWELYLLRIFSCLGFSVEVHPALPDATTQPDFRMTRGADDFLMEAATTFSGIVEEGRNATREGWIKDAINRGRSLNFFVGLQFEKMGLARPKNREVVAPIEAWLNELDPDELLLRGEFPTRRFSFRDWEITVRAIPKSPERRIERPDDRLLGLGPTEVGYVDHRVRLQRALQRKSGRYGTPSVPLVSAVLLVSSFGDDEAVHQALFGSIAVRFAPGRPGTEQVRQRDGFWMPGAEPRGTRVSAVLVGNGLMPWNVVSKWPRLWLNPWAAIPMTAELPFPRALGDEQGAVAYYDAEGSPDLILRFSDAWPDAE